MFVLYILLLICECIFSQEFDLDYQDYLDYEDYLLDYGEYLLSYEDYRKMSKRICFKMPQSIERLQFSITYSSLTENITLIPDYKYRYPFNKNIETVFIVHGYWNNRLPPWQFHIKNTLLKMKAYNIFLIGWNSKKLIFTQAAANTKSIAGGIAQFIQKLIKEKHLNPNKVTLIGHSLGAHIMGFVGKLFQQRNNGLLSRIIGLDPAGPCFGSVFETNNRLLPSDAQFVQVIHSNVFVYGLYQRSGHIDFYMNGEATDQPACRHKPFLLYIMCHLYHRCEHRLIDQFLLNVCHHSMVIYYFMDTLKPNCELWGCREGKNRKKRCVKLGMNTYNSNIKGKFVVNTPEHRPFCNLRRL